jgi:hypothetical protein
VKSPPSTRSYVRPAGAAVSASRDPGLGDERRYAPRVAEAKVLRSATKPRRSFLKAKLVLVGALGLAGLVAYETGWLGWAWADALSHSLPKDEAILGYLPADTTAVAVIDLHLFKLASIGPAGGQLPAAIQRVREEVKKTIDLDLVTDIDKLAVTPGLVVARGRFSFKKLGDKLVELHYAPADHRGVYYFAKHNQDALAVVKDEILLWGDESALKAALDARDGGMTLDKDEAVTERLKKAGWKHALIASIRVDDDKPSLKSIVTGAKGTRAVTLAAATGAGLDIDADVETASPPAAKDMLANLDRQRQVLEALEPLVGKELAAALMPVGKRAVLTQQGGDVVIHTHADPSDLDAIGQALAQPGPVHEAFDKLKSAP